MRFIAATPAARAALLERQRGTLSLRGFAGAGPPGGAGVADLSALMQQLQEVEQLPTALRASATASRCDSSKSLQGCQPMTTWSNVCLGPSVWTQALPPAHEAELCLGR